MSGAKIAKKQKSGWKQQKGLEFAQIRGIYILISPPQYSTMDSGILDINNTSHVFIF